MVQSGHVVVEHIRSSADSVLDSKRLPTDLNANGQEVKVLQDISLESAEWKIVGHTCASRYT